MDFPDSVPNRGSAAQHADSVERKASFADIENEIKASSDALAELVGQLTGDEFAVKGLEALINKEDKE